MPVSDDQKIFGKKDTPNIDVALPVRYADYKHILESIFLEAPSSLIESTANAQCAIDVTMNGPPVRANWYDIWGAAVMVVAMCARFGRSGVSSGTGTKPFSCRVVHTDVRSQLVRRSLRSGSRMMPLQTCPRLRREGGVTSFFGSIVMAIERS